ncbi:hypothetical protein TSAR_016596 [Trichomalopsis sarcophagae]|uniref:Uncharacterized protein n=1 Tax=Trichomalopsis sarcophagae TaxID=543379 RepID=A0A232F314_9HYME|nr:hypothetical protein TSAR_016596 [Trichomalopsis sarcophagae]
MATDYNITVAEVKSQLKKSNHSIDRTFQRSITHPKKAFYLLKLKTLHCSPIKLSSILPKESRRQTNCLSRKKNTQSPKETSDPRKCPPRNITKMTITKTENS